MTAVTSSPAVFSASIVFPPPPPTTNALTAEQRAQLRKSTKKLGQILGATPHLMDADIVSLLGPVHVELPSRSATPSSVFTRSSSLDFYSTGSSSSSSFDSPHPYAASSFCERRDSTSLPSRSNSLRIANSGQPDRPNTSASSPAPILRLSLDSPSGRSPYPPSPSPRKASTRLNFIETLKHRARSHSLDALDNTSDMYPTIHPTPFPESSSTDSPTDPSFMIHSSFAARRQKVNRIRKVLGDNVPVNLIFPGGDEQNRPTTEAIPSSSANVQRSASLPPVAVAGTVIPRPKKAHAGKITATRDSVGSLTPHKAKKLKKDDKEKSKTKQEGKEKSRSKSEDKERSKFKQEVPLTPFPSVQVTTSAPASKDPSRAQHLCVIVESPEEHGTGPFEDFGFGGSAMKKKTIVVESEWHVNGPNISSRVDHNEEAVKLWSTRKGYNGWDRSAVSTKSELERKRSMSYRKPPPRIDF